MDDMTVERTTFPETTRYKWEGLTLWSFQEAERHMRAGMTGLKDSPRWRAFKQVIDALYLLADRKGVSQFKGDKLKLLLIAAARENEWHARGGRQVADTMSASPDTKLCRRCYEFHPLASFRAVATPAQKARNGWNADAQYFVQSLLCAACRPLKHKADQVKARRQALKGSKVSIIDLYRTGISRNMNAVASVVRSHTHNIGGFMDVQFTDQNDRLYYEKRLEYLKLARARLSERIDDGSLTRAAEGENPPMGLWQELLTKEERDWLGTLYRQGSWVRSVGQKGREPRLWDSRPVEPKRKAPTPPPPRIVDGACPSDVLLPGSGPGYVPGLFDDEINGVGMP
jgi:hypothetical protein